MVEGGGLENRCAPDVTNHNNTSCDSDAGEFGAQFGALLREDADLRAIVTAWPHLPAPIRAAIRAMVQAAAEPEAGRGAR